MCPFTSYGRRRSSPAPTRRRERSRRKLPSEVIRASSSARRGRGRGPWRYSSRARSKRPCHLRAGRWRRRGTVWLARWRTRPRVHRIGTWSSAAGAAWLSGSALRCDARPASVGAHSASRPLRVVLDPGPPPCFLSTPTHRVSTCPRSRRCSSAAFSAAVSLGRCDGTLHANVLISRSNPSFMVRRVPAAMHWRTRPATASLTSSSPSPGGSSWLRSAGRRDTTVANAAAAAASRAILSPAPLPRSAGMTKDSPSSD